MKGFHKGLAVLALCLSALSAFAAPVDINTANEAELAQGIDGVGLKKAQAIVKYRTENGPFKSVAELTRVRGIGLRTLQANEENITIGNQ